MPCLLLLAALLPCQQVPDPWKQKLQLEIRNHNLEEAQQILNRRTEETPADLEAHGWRARVLAWRGHWSEAEDEYRCVLRQVPNDKEILTGLADVLTWQQRPKEALQVLNQARTLAPADTEILIRRAHALTSVGRIREARAQLREILGLEPSNSQAKAGLSGLTEVTAHELRLGADIDTFNYTDLAQTYAVNLHSRWTQRWSTLLGTTFYQRFGETATRFAASTAVRLTKKDWLNVGGSAARDRGIVPHTESLFEYGHAFKFRGRTIRGLESSYQQCWLWYRDARILTVRSTQLFYLPRDWTWTFSATGARSNFSGSAAEWRPSGMTKLGFPLQRGLTGSIFFATGSENFALVDQIGSFSARTYGGGIRYRWTNAHDMSAYVAHQDRSTGRTQTSFGVSYGFRF